MIEKQQPICQLCHIIKQHETLQLAIICAKNHILCLQCYKQSQHQGNCISCKQKDQLNKNNLPKWQQLIKNGKKVLMFQQEKQFLKQFQQLLNNEYKRLQKQNKTNNIQSFKPNHKQFFNNSLNNSMIEINQISLISIIQKQQLQQNGNRIGITKRQLQEEKIRSQSFQKIKQQNYLIVDCIAIIIVYACFMSQFIFLGLHYLQSLSIFPIQARYSAFIIYSSLLCILVIILTFSDITKQNVCCKNKNNYEILMNKITFSILFPVNFFLIFSGLILIQEKWSIGHKLHNKFLFPISNKRILKRWFYYSLFLIPNIVFMIFWAYTSINIDLWKIYQTSMMDSISIFFSLLLFIVLPYLDERYKYELKRYYNKKDKTIIKNKQTQIKNQTKINPENLKTIDCIYNYK